MADTKQFDWDAWCARRYKLEERGFFDDDEVFDEDEVYDKETDDI